MAQAQERSDNKGKEVALIPVDQLAPMRLPVTVNMLGQLAISEAEYRVLTDQLYPGARTVEAISMVLSYCRRRNLDPFKKPCHIVPMWSTPLKRMVETVWPGIAELRTTATRTKVYAGVDDAIYGPMIDHEFKQTIEDEFRQPKDITTVVKHPEWCKLTVYRFVNGIKCPFTVTVFWDEAYATTGRGSEVPNEMWRKRARGQLFKCTEAAALRMAFPEELGSEYAAEEMAGKVLTDETIEYAVIPDRAPPPRPPRRAAQPNPNSAPNPQPRGEPQTGGDKIEDAEFEVDDDLADDQIYFADLREAMNAAPDAATVEEVWTKADPMAKFEGDEVSQTICQKIKSLRLKQIAGA